MKMDYTLEGDHLIVGNKELITSELKLATGKVKRGDIVDLTGAIITDTGKVFGIVAQDADATAGATKTVVFGDFGRKRFGIAADLRGKAFKRIRSKNAAVLNHFVDVVAPTVLAAVLRISRGRLIADNPKHFVRLLQRGLCHNVAAFVFGHKALAFLIYKNLIFGACPQTAAEGTGNRMRAGHKLNESHAHKICAGRFTHDDAVATVRQEAGA